MFYEKYKTLFLENGAGNNYDMPTASDKSKNNVFSRNAEMLVGRANGQPNIQGLGVDNALFKPSTADYAPPMKPAAAQNLQPQYPDYPKRAGTNYENQRLQMNELNVFKNIQPANPTQAAPTNSKAKEALTSDIFKQAFTWNEQDRQQRPPLPKKAQQPFVANQENDDLVFGQLERKDPAELLNGKVFRTDPNKNKVTYNFITGEDYGFKKKMIAAPKGMSSEGVGDMFQVLREATHKNEQAQLLKQQKEEDSHNRERDKSNSRGQRDSADLGSNGTRRGTGNGRKPASLEDPRTLEQLAYKVLSKERYDEALRRNMGNPKRIQELKEAINRRVQRHTDIEERRLKLKRNLEKQVLQ